MSIIDEMRDDALAAFHAAVAAVQPARLIPTAVSVDGNCVSIRGEALPEVAGRQVVAALGKAAPTLAEAWLELLPDWADELLVLTPHDVPVPDRVATHAEVLRGAHPSPDEQGEASCRRLLELAESLGEDDLLLVLLSGGASALLAAPRPGLTLDDIRATTTALLSSGATIHQLNAVRRQLLAAAGGGLGRAAAPARVVTLVLSDVLGDLIPDIGSGPTVPSPTTAADALGVLGGLGVVADLPRTVVDVLRARVETAGDDAWAERSRIHVLANNRTAVDAAAASLTGYGYRTIAHPGDLTGEARDRGALLARFAESFSSRRPTAFVAGGETTVTVRGSGSGGRNHELALAAALELSGRRQVVILAAGTDGIDGLADAAGAVVDPGTVARARVAGVDLTAALAGNDSGPALAATGDAIRTGPTGTNVCDLVLVLTA
jgi:hydroxypyruvate reductase